MVQERSGDGGERSIRRTVRLLEFMVGTGLLGAVVWAVALTATVQAQGEDVRKLEEGLGKVTESIEANEKRVEAEKAAQAERQKIAKGLCAMGHLPRFQCAMDGYPHPGDPPATGQTRPPAWGLAAAGR